MLPDVLGNQVCHYDMYSGFHWLAAHYVTTPQFKPFHVVQAPTRSELGAYVQYDPLWTCMTVTVVLHTASSYGNVF
jgi:hypothetical protein